MKKDFKNKNVMIIVPHQDDELNICGSMFVSDYFDMDKVKIVFSTNGDYVCNYHARVRETNKIIKKLKLKKENVIYLGYSDQYSREDSHLYLTHSPDVFVSKKGNDETFSDNYHFKKYNKNAKFNYENFVNDIIDVINDNRPDVIFTIDFDSHPDHRALSLAFEKAIGSILKKDREYKPLIYKAFAYPTYYKGIGDFNSKTGLKTKFKTEDYSLCEMQNPYYDFDDRVSYDVNNNRLLLFNKSYKLFRIYRSQLIIKRIYSILNDDMVFFERRSDNLLNRANVVVSSGDAEYLSDFMLFDVDTITHGDTEKVKLSNKAWVFDKNDNKKEIIIELDKEYSVKELVLYQNLFDDSRVKEISINVGGKDIVKELDGNVNRIKLDNKTNIIVIKVVKYEGLNAGFSEIELFDSIRINEKVIEEGEYKEDKIIKLINDIILNIDIFVSRVFNKIDRIRGKL